MPNSKPKVCDIIRSILDDRIYKEGSHSKLCKDTKIHKTTCIDQYQFIGFKLIGLDGLIHDCDYEYYKNFINDIKTLQFKITESLRIAGYAVTQVILQPANSKNHWSLSFTITTCDYHEDNSVNKKTHAVCVKHK